MVAFGVVWSTTILAIFLTFLVGYIAEILVIWLINRYLFFQLDFIW